MVLRALITGVGEFGKNLGLALYKYALHNPWCNKRLSHVFVCDLYPSEQWAPMLTELKELLETGRIDFSLNYHMIAQRGARVQAGVGKFWPLSANYATKYFDDYFNSLLGILERTDISLYAIAGSSGGGTGCGVVPEWAKLSFPEIPKFYKVQGTQVFTPVVTVLPFEGEYFNISESNAATFLGRVFKHAKTIILADNEFVKKICGLSQDATKQHVNEKLILSLISLLLASPPFEAADSNLAFGLDNRASIAVPAVKEFYIKDLEKWRPELFIRETLSKPLSDLKPPIRKLLILALYPDSCKFEVKEDVKNLVRSLYPLVRDIHYEPHSSQFLSNTFIISAFFIDPYVPRLKKLLEKLESFTKNEKGLGKYINGMIRTVPSESYDDLENLISESRKIIRSSCDLYKEFLRLYFRDLGLPNSENPSDSEGGGLIAPLGAISEPPESPPLYRRKSKSIQVLVRLQDFQWEGLVREFEDRSIYEMLKEILAGRDNFGPEMLETLEFLATIDGMEIPLTFGALKLSVSDLPIDKIVIRNRK